MSELLKIVSSQYKHLPSRGSEYIDRRVITDGSILRNEPFSFQALYRGTKRAYEPVSIWLETDLPAAAWRVDYVAVSHVPISESFAEYESKEPGLFPDILTPRPVKADIITAQNSRGVPIYFEKDVKATLNAVSDQFQSVWFTVNPDNISIPAGEYRLRVAMTSLLTNQVIAEESLSLCVIDQTLPRQNFYYTNWFHVDCLCDMFGVKPYSNAFYRIFDQYIRNMTRHCQNTLLLPAFTPALDTVVGAERMNVQLVEIERTQDGWLFGFEKMRRFIRRARKNGIEFFEHAHIFSQWGARNAPNIYDRSGQRLFGCDTVAAGEEYIGFIRAYLKALLSFAREEGIEQKLLMHLSDEPQTTEIENYRTVRAKISDLLAHFPVCDAMFDCSFYEEGLVDQPILHIKSLSSSDVEKCPSAWLYYTGGEEGMTNRKIPNTAAATRMLGVLMYRYRAKGFLQWAYNFYYDRLSFGFADPRVNPNAYKQFPGITSLCYPTYENGKVTVNPSLREKLMGEAMNDYRALRRLEEKIGREATLALCEEKLGEIGVYTVPTGEDLRQLRERINAAIAE